MAVGPTGAPAADGDIPDRGRRATKSSTKPSGSRTAKTRCVTTSPSPAPTRRPLERTSTAPCADTFSSRTSATNVTSIEPACGSGTGTDFGPIFGSTATAYEISIGCGPAACSSSPTPPSGVGTSRAGSPSPAIDTPRNAVGRGNNGTVVHPSTRTSASTVPSTSSTPSPTVTRRRAAWTIASSGGRCPLPVPSS